MAGLLDVLNSDEGMQALGLLAAAGPSPTPMSFGQRLFGAMQQDQARRSATEERKLKQQFMQAQMQDMLAQAKQREAAAAKQGDAMKLLQSVVGSQDAPSQYGLAGQGLSMGGVSEPMTPRRGGLAGATPEQLLMLKVAGIDATELAKQARTGDKIDAGAYYLRNGQREYMADPTKGISLADGRVSLIPGSLEAQTALAGATKGAEAAATAAYDPVQGIMPDGSQGIIGTRKSISERFGQTAAPRPQQLPLLDQVRAAMARNGDTAANFDIGGVRGSIGGPSAAPAGGGIKTGFSPQEKASAETVALGNQSFMKDRYAPALEAGDAASQTIAATQAARTALTNLGRSGWGTPVIAGAASVLGALGVPQAEKFASNAQMFQSAAMGRLWTTLNAAKGPQTEGDADRASKTFAKLENTPQANDFILDMTQATAERERLKAQYFREALPMAQQSGDLQEIERRWSRIAPSVFAMPTMKRWAQ